MAASGRAEVYRVTRGDGGCEIRFALGTAHGISPGAGVAIYDEGGRQVGTGTVEASNRKSFCGPGNQRPGDQGGIPGVPRLT